jgi:hypothetical protein
MLTLSRPAVVGSSEDLLARECASARWTHHRLLDFEQAHQRVLDAVADAIVPGITRLGRILARLAARGRRAERSSPGAWRPDPRPELAARLRGRLAELRAVRNADPRWKTALAWADTPEAEAPERGSARRRAGESDEEFAARCAARRTLLTRREAYRAKLYAERRIYWGTWNALVRSVDQARKAVVRCRAQGIPADIRRPKYRDPVTLAAENGGFRMLERGVPWWTIQVRVGVVAEWVQLRAKCGTWHNVPPDAELRTLKLTRRKDGERWAYSISIAVDMHKLAAPRAESRVVAFDWGHREHGHARATEGVRAFTWLGDDGACGEVLIPKECRQALDEIDALKSGVDSKYDARRAALALPHRNRYLYRRALMMSGVRSAEESDWLRWEMRKERRIAALRKRVDNLRRETYLRAVRELRARYAVFAFEDESVPRIQQKQKVEQMNRRQRSTRDLAARYEFTQLCERSGADVITVSARNTTRECPDCGQLDENGPELLIACSGCGRVRDKDHGATRVILARAMEALANRAA